MTGSPSPPQQTGGTLRCRECGARLAPNVTWCSLCLTPTAIPVAAPPPEPEPERVLHEVRPSEPGARPHPGRHAQKTGDGAGSPDAEVLLAELAARESPAAVRPALGVLKAHLALGQVPGGRYALAFGGGLLLLVLLMAGLTLLGMLV